MNHTRVDIMNVEEALKLFEYFEKVGAKTRKEREKALADFRKADLVVEGSKEHVEAKIAGSFKTLIVEHKK